MSKFSRARAALAVTVLVAGLTAVQHTTATAAPDTATVQSNPADGVLNQGSRTLDFDHGWKFKLVNTADTTDPSGVYGNSDNPLAAAPGFDDSSWRSLTLPHDWSIEQQPQSNQSNATGYFPGGLGWYRKTFTLPKSMAGERISVDFDGVYMNSYVYLNGELLGNHPYGYTGFSFDITDHVHTDGTPNVLAVVVQNKQPSSRWYSGSGITRNVHLTVTDPVHVARWGTFVTTPDLATTVQSHYANVHVQTQVDNPDGAPVDVVSTVLDANGRDVATGHGTSGRHQAGQPAPVVDDRPVPLHAADADRAAPARGRHLRHDVRGSVADVRFGEGHLPQRQPPETAGRRPAQRSGRARFGRQLRRVVAADEHPQERRCERVPHIAQPAVAGDDRRLPAPGHRDDGRGVRRVDRRARSPTTTTCTSTSGATPTSPRWSTRRRTRPRSSCGRSATRSPVGSRRPTSRPSSG